MARRMILKLLTLRQGFSAMIRVLWADFWTYPALYRKSTISRRPSRLTGYSQVKVFPQIDLTDSGEVGLNAKQKLHKSVVQGV